MELTLTELGGMIRDIKIRATLGAGDMIRALYVLPEDPRLQAGNQGLCLGRGRRRRAQVI